MECMQETGPPPGTADLVIVANRLPVALRRGPDGTEAWQRAPGGLVSAVEPALRGRRAAWVGWSGAADGDLPHLPDASSSLCAVHLSEREIADYYEGYANSTLWPLYHDSVVEPVDGAAWWEGYAAINRRFAQRAAEAAAPGASVWVHDYHLQLVPSMLRAYRPDLRIGFFLHIPFPPAEIFERLGQREAILHGLLGADVVGFQGPQAAANFALLAARHAGAEPATGIFPTGHALRVGGRTVVADAFPVSIDAEGFGRLADTPAARLAAGVSASRPKPSASIETGKDRKSTRLNSSHESESRMPSSA